MGITACKVLSLYDHRCQTGPIPLRIDLRPCGDAMKATVNHEDVQQIREIDEREMQAEPEEFSPKGAIAFFISMLIGFGIIWGCLYAIMVHRALHL